MKNQKKFLCLFLVLLLSLTVLAGCGSKETAETSTESSVEGTDVVFVDPNAVKPDYGKLGFASNGFTFGIYDEIAPVIAEIGEPSGTFEAPSCAHQGSDYFYYYSGFELTCNIFDDVERITAITIVDDTVSTPQGLFIAMSAEDMLSTIASYTFSDEGNGRYLITDRGCVLQVLVKNDIIASITYLPKE